jgi:hypothetical protein
VSPEFYAETLELLVLDHLRLLATRLLAQFDGPKYGVSVDHLEVFDLFDKGIRTVVFSFVAHTSGSSNFYRIQEDL